jgi:hypothetical protein
MDGNGVNQAIALWKTRRRPFAEPLHISFELSLHGSLDAYKPARANHHRQTEKRPRGHENVQNRTHMKRPPDEHENEQRLSQENQGEDHHILGTGPVPEFGRIPTVVSHCFDVIPKHAKELTSLICRASSRGRRNTFESFDPTALPLENRLQSMQT